METRIIFNSIKKNVLEWKEEMMLDWLRLSTLILLNVKLIWTLTAFDHFLIRTKKERHFIQSCKTYFIKILAWIYFREIYSECKLVYITQEVNENMDHGIFTQIIWFVTYW